MYDRCAAMTRLSGEYVNGPNGRPRIDHEMAGGTISGPAERPRRVRQRSRIVVTVCAGVILAALLASATMSPRPGAAETVPGDADDLAQTAVD